MTLDFFFKLKTAVHEKADSEGEEDNADKSGDKSGNGDLALPVGGEEGCKLQVVADELLTDAKDVSKALKQKTVNTVVLDIAKRPTVMGSVKMCMKVQEAGWSVVVGGRSGETVDTFISDLAVGLGVGQFKCGAPCHSEHISKYNQLLRISSGPNAPAYSGKKYRTGKQFSKLHSPSNSRPSSRAGTPGSRPPSRPGTGAGSRPGSRAGGSRPSSRAGTPNK